MRIVLIILTVINISLKAQGNDPLILKANKITALTISNCLSKNSCLKDVYKFNSCGMVSYFHPAMVAWSMTFKYNANCELIEENTSNYRISKFKTLSSDSTLKTTKYFEKDSLTYADTTITANVNQHNIVDFSNGNFVEHTGELHFACGIEYLGKHKHVYHKNTLGLIDFVEIFNEKGEVVINLNYAYEK